MLRRFAQGLLLYAVLLQFAVMSTAYNLGAALLLPFLRGARGAAAGRTGISRGYRLYWWFPRALGVLDIDAAALDALHAEPGGLIIAANHPTSLDALILVARLQRSVCIMKAELMRNFFLGAGARLAQYIRNDPAHHVIREAVRMLRDEGAQLVMFPEGTRTVRRPVNPFRPGLTLIAQRAGVPIQAVIIETETPYLGKGWPIWRVPPRFPVRIRVRLGERFAPDPDHAALLARLQRYFERELNGVSDGVEPVAATSTAT
jgi:1-acyl-sn-glycerol-3-phosphate acyltransferase